jgi:hypothetical protein
MTTPCASFASRPCSADLSTSSGNVSRRSLGAGRASVSRWERIARHVLVASLFLVVLGAALPSWATTYTVTSTTDSGTGSLRAALGMAANGDTIDFSLAYPATITLTSGQLRIVTSVTISGPGPANLFISGSGEIFGVFYVTSGITATISGVTIENGSNVNYGESGGITNLGTLTGDRRTIIALDYWRIRRSWGWSRVAISPFFVRGLRKLFLRPG